MLNDAMQIVLQFRVFLIAAIIVALAMEIALLFGTKHFGWQRKNLWIYRFFFGLTRPQCCFLAAFYGNQCPLCRGYAAVPSGDAASVVGGKVHGLEADADAASRFI